MAVRPKCPLCGIDLKHPYETKKINNEMKEVLVEEQVSFWMHNPRLIQEDILVIAHKRCFEQVKRVYPKFDEPTQRDWNNPLFPIIVGSSVRMVNLSTFEKLRRL